MIDETKKTRGIFEKEKGSGVFWIRYTDGSGRYRRERAGSKSFAQKLLDKRRGEAVQRKKLPESLRRKFVSFGEIADDALLYSEKHKKSYKDDKSKMSRLKEWWATRDAESLTTPEIEQQLAAAEREGKWAPSTYNHHRSLMMLIYREAKRAGKVTANPTREVRHRHEDNSRVRFLSDEEEKQLRKVIAESYPRHLPEFDLAISTGLRKGSMYSITWEMVDWDGRMLNIPTSKNGEPLHIPLNHAAMDALKTARAHGNTGGRVFQSEKTGEPLLDSRHWFEDALTAAKISDFHWHDLRHCYATKLRMRGAKLEDISELLGHKSLTMTKRYSHIGPNQLHEVAALLNSVSTTVAPEATPVTVVPPKFLF
jgi:site-specific recombinase XerD